MEDYIKARSLGECDECILEPTDETIELVDPFNFEIRVATIYRCNECGVSMPVD